MNHFLAQSSHHLNDTQHSFGVLFFKILFWVCVWCPCLCAEVVRQLCKFGSLQLSMGTELWSPGFWSKCLYQLSLLTLKIVLSDNIKCLLQIRCTSHSYKLALQPGYYPKWKSKTVKIPHLLSYLSGISLSIF